MFLAIETEAMTTKFGSARIHAYDSRSMLRHTCRTQPVFGQGPLWI
jgi:hypothetical protein